MTLTSIKTPYATVTKLPQGVIKQVWDAVYIDDITLLEEHLTLVEKFIEHKPHKFIADLHQAKGISKPCRDIMASERVQAICTATAMIVASNLSRILATLFLKFNKSTIPIKIFTNEEKAIIWLVSKKK